MTHADDLRAWAKGSYTTEAATELLLRAFGGRYATVGNPWIQAATTTAEGYLEHAWVDSDIRTSADGSTTRHPGYLDSLHPWPQVLRAVK